jgi:hypothetical protein
MAIATQRALAERAIRAARVMEYWHKWLATEVEKQGVDPFSENQVSINADKILAMREQMAVLVSEIRKFEKNLAG